MKYDYKLKTIIFIIILILLVSSFLLFVHENKISSSIKENSYLRNKYKNTEPLDYNIILVSIDTLRADHLGVYGYEQNTSPNIDIFSKDAVLFKNMIAQAPSTAESHASIFTSLIPSHHTCFQRLKTTVPQKIITLAEILEYNNYQTVSFNDGGFLSEEFGLNQGFQLYNNLRTEENYFSERVDKANKWINENSENNFFLFIHTFEVHTPYTPEKKYLDEFESTYSGDLPKNSLSQKSVDEINSGIFNLTIEDKEHIIALYDGGIKSMDDAFGEFIDYLKQENIYDKSLIIFTADHGEEFGEHGMYAIHSHTLYDELLRIPLIIKFPNSEYAGTAVENQASSIDIMPTTLEFVGIPLLDSFEGTSLLEYIKSEELFNFLAVSEMDYEHQSIRSKKWKLYDNYLFNLEYDPLEQIDVSKNNSDVRNQLQEKLFQILNNDFERVESKNAEISAQTLEQLKELGYLD